jgi:beta-lactam-binding protein with PASTA domain
VTPKLKGEKLASAKRGLKRANCALGRVKRKSGRKPGIVVSQRPKPGRTMPAGTKVSIVVGKR